MKLFPNAKVNLGLAIMRKREDGYHDLETIFLPVSELCDELEVTIRPATKPTGGSAHTSTGEQTIASVDQPVLPYTLLQEGIAVDCPAADNLIIKTYMTMREKYDRVGDVSIRFCKNIPFGAGLGGGSSDAAYMAKAINTLFELGLSDEELEAIVSPLGADCAFFVQNRPRVATGIGNVFADVDEALLRSLEGKYFVLVKPECAVSTGQAYRGIVTREKQGRPSMLSQLREAADMTEAMRVLTNDFEQTVFPLFPEIADIKQRLQDLGASYAAMSGSGATVFGIFDEMPHSASSYFPNCFVHEQMI
ncbi:MAG: 4-(cytidine 5'-diphospho)-2-C-methyl-D-erythritol kinase [Paludibacteraceae bacterium]|nr:4-(cytidine 5'-diphospho)-2-C-methyl-D-erythritol kinase [Paludibacteraceae bacterium]